MASKLDIAAKTAQLLSGDPVVMGVVNVTPDSFSDGGRFISKNKAVEHAHQLIQEGASILDIGGESSRPGAEVIEVSEEIEQGNPQNMQDSPAYDSVVSDIIKQLQLDISRCATCGIDIGRLVVDPGIGFGKTTDHNLLTLRNIREFSALGVPLLLGTSRKSFIAKISKGEDANERLGGSLSSVIFARSQGVKMFRVHDVAETVQALKVYDAIANTV